jgi:hypothetical protein
LAQRILQLEATACRAMTWFSAKWIALTAAGFVGMSAMAWASVWWQRNAVNELTEQKTALEADIAEMQVNAAALAKKGARIKIDNCGGRLCVAVNTDQGQSHVDWRGAWHAADGAPLAIPKGY